MAHQGKAPALNRLLEIVKDDTGCLAVGATPEDLHNSRCLDEAVFRRFSVATKGLFL